VPFLAAWNYGCAALLCPSERLAYTKNVGSRILFLLAIARYSVSGTIIRDTDTTIRSKARREVGEVAGLIDGSTPAAFEAILAALFAFLAWWIRDMSIHTRTRLEKMDSERWALRADVNRLMGELEDTRDRLSRLENSPQTYRRPPR
jgi:hypothetical protein